MLEIRTACENCGKDLPNETTQAMICSFECTFCFDCVNDIIKNVCPNCGGNFEKRPIRLINKLIKYPVSISKLVKPINPIEFNILLQKNQYLLREER
jgi:hypothetical protein